MNDIISINKARELNWVKSCGLEGKFVCHIAKDDNVSSALNVLMKTFPYLTILEDLEARVSRFGEDPFTLNRSPIMGPALTDSKEYLELNIHDRLDEISVYDFGIHDILVSRTKAIVEGLGMVCLPTVYDDQGPYIIIRPELEHAHPKMHSVLKGASARMSSIRPRWEILSDQLTPTKSEGGAARMSLKSLNPS